MSLLWNGHLTGLPLLKVAWCALGALAATLFAAAAGRAFGPSVGRAAGVLLAGATSLLVLSTVLDGETPYLALVGASFLLVPPLLAAPLPALPLAAWSVLNALACLFRAEHGAFWLATFTWLVLRGARTAGAAASTRALAGGLAAFVLPLLPWHLAAWDAAERLNSELRRDPADPVQQLAAQLGPLPWDAEAAAWRERLPAFTRDASATFVAATARQRGRTRVGRDDVRVLAEAFGSEPRPLPTRFFVALYGPLNLALGNHPRAGPGFGHQAMDEPPPLRPSAESYPAMLVSGLPPRDLALSYPPHLRLITEGHRLAFAWWRADPAAALVRAARKLGRFWTGACVTLTGFGLPLGREGPRWAVDLAVAADTAWSRLWRVAVLAAAAFGAWSARREPALVPWLLFLASKAAVAALVFGYARVGATALPVVALLLALAARPLLAHRRAAAVLAAGLLALAALEAARAVHPPPLLLDGRPAGPRDPFPPDDHLDHQLGLSPR